jgi:hypothetical protein
LPHVLRHDAGAAYQGAIDIDTDQTDQRSYPVATSRDIVAYQSRLIQGVTS